MIDRQAPTAMTWPIIVGLMSRSITHAVRFYDGDYEWAKAHVADEETEWTSVSELMSELLSEYRKLW